MCHIPFGATFIEANTIAKPDLNRKTISWMVVKHLLFPVKVSGSPLGYLLGNYTYWSDCVWCVWGADCTSLRLLVNTNPLPHSPNCEWQSILWKTVLHKPPIGFALDFENCQSGLWGIRREVDLTLTISVKWRSALRRVGVWIIVLQQRECLKTMSWMLSDPPDEEVRGQVESLYSEAGPPWGNKERDVFLWSSDLMCAFKEF